ncbi:sigma 54-interacting transcriptional regulator [Aliiglaciecola litoralis]|uniref:Diguanylate cyclase n=1 Tax=Aliiglaciecola litoralis TaxID=582857 RepID=A0ABN1LMQ2_9ALTE
MFHPLMNDKLGDVFVGEWPKGESPIAADSCYFDQKVPVLARSDSGLELQRVSDTQMLVKISESVFEEFEEVATTELESEESATEQPKTRRAPLLGVHNDMHCWLRLNFSQGAPAWLTENAWQHSAEGQIAIFENMLLSAGMQIRLVGEYLSWLSDPLTNLCPRPVLQNKLSMLSENYSVGLVMLHCIDFHQINKKFGHEFGDNVIREIAQNLKEVTREGDILSRFGGALFGVGFPVNEKTDVASLAKKLQGILQQKQYLEGAINIAFDIGAAIVEYDEGIDKANERSSTLISRADQALKVAQQENQPSIITWQNDDFRLYQQQFNYLGGIFTADTITDYRNMLLLWDISSLIADKHDFSQLSQSVVQRLAQTFDFTCGGIIGGDDEAKHNFKYSIDDSDNAIELTTKDSAYLSEIKQMQKSVVETKKPSERYIGDAMILVLPLEIESQDCFFICGNAERFEVKHDTKVLLSGLTRQLGKALRRSRLEEELNRKLESQNEQLQNELAQLKVGLQVSSIIYRSDAMENLMKHTKRAAMTDTTVLVTGESGTGKERLINALHQMGNRSDKPFVIVDCGSIPETLIESELFGYVKGAFTGAQNTSSGKVLDANGGVLVLDEIGELPLNMQTKLLRFVQEKHFTPVGGNKLISVDVKIIAVTNRDLAHEVELGNFRKDLYYRLNVLTLHNPPLRDRADDIALLSTHFLNKFAQQFKVEKRSLSPQALQKMYQYSWPGNIRELENRLMQATLMCEGSVIEWELLNIEEQPQTPITSDNVRQVANHALNNQSSSVHSASDDIASTSRSLPENPTPAPIHAAEDNTLTFIHSEDCLAHLLEVFKQQLATAGQHPRFFNAPFGTWIEEELIIKTYLATDRKMRLTAARLSISQSTARRKVDKIIAETEHSPSERPQGWESISEALVPIATGQLFIANCVAKIKLVVLESILSTPVYSMAQAAEMLGVSEPTFYKLKKELESLSN